MKDRDQRSKDDLVVTHIRVLVKMIVNNYLRSKSSTIFIKSCVLAFSDIKAPESKFDLR